MGKILGINGIKTHGKSTTDRALAGLEVRGYKTLDVNQPIRHSWDARWKKKKDAKAIIEVAEDGDAIICHSYGGIKTAIAMEGIDFKAAFFFRPAMGRGHDFPGWQDTKIYCIHSLGDTAIWAGSVLLFHPFGLAGVYGFTDPFVTNVKTTGAHSVDFEDANLGRWIEFIDQKLDEVGFLKEK